MNQLLWAWCNLHIGPGQIYALDLAHSGQGWHNSRIGPSLMSNLWKLGQAQRRHWARPNVRSEPISCKCRPNVVIRPGQMQEFVLYCVDVGPMF